MQIDFSAAYDRVNHQGILYSSVSQSGRHRPLVGAGTNAVAASCKIGGR